MKHKCFIDSTCDLVIYRSQKRWEMCHDRREKNMNRMDNLFLVPFDPLSNIEITKYFNYAPRFNGIF